MQIWALANQKGGVGKTTSTVALGGLAAKAGQKVLLIDLDPQGSLTCYFGLNPDLLQDTSLSLFQHRKAFHTLNQPSLIKPTNYSNLSIMPASTGLATLERQVIGSDGMGLVIKQYLAYIQASFDVVLLDCPPQLGVLMVNAIAACEQLIIPVQTEFLALKGLERILNTLAMMQKSRKTPLNYVILPTLFDRRTAASVHSLNSLNEQYQIGLWPEPIPVDTKLRDASKAGVPPHIYSPDSRGVAAYARLLDYLQPQSVSKLVPLPCTVS